MSITVIYPRGREVKTEPPDGADAVPVDNVYVEFIEGKAKLRVEYEK